MHTCLTRGLRFLVLKRPVVQPQRCFGLSGTLLDPNLKPPDQNVRGQTKEVARTLVEFELQDMFKEIHAELDAEIHHTTELASLAKYYFDGQGKAIRPVISLTLAHAINRNFKNEANDDLLSKQRQVAIICEMIHTASLVHDDVIDKADTRRGKKAVNMQWSASKSTLAGDYIIAIGSKLISQLRNDDVVINLAQILADLVRGEFQQLQVHKDETERFQLYLSKTFNKTASLIANSCKAIAILSRDHSRQTADSEVG